MSSSTSHLDLLADSQSNKETVANVLFDAMSPNALFGRRPSTSSGLTWGYYGGTLKIPGGSTATVNNGTVSLTASQTNYIEANNAGVVSVSTSGFGSGIPLYTVICNGTGATSWTDHRPSILNAAVDKDVLTTHNAVTGTQAINLSLGNTVKLNLTGNVTVSFTNPPTSGTPGRWAIIATQDGTGGRRITWPAAVTWVGGRPIEITGAGITQVYDLVTVDGGTTYYGMVRGGVREVDAAAFGLTSGGVVDNLTPLRAALALALSNPPGSSYSGVLTTPTRPRLRLPTGSYRVSDFISADTANAITWLEIIGDRTVIVADAGVTIFGGVGGHVNIEGITFQGGACPISIRTNNVDMSLIGIRRCKFYGHTHTCFRADGNSASTLLLVEDSLFYQPNNTYGQICILGTGVGGTSGIDKSRITGCWMTYGHDTLNPIENTNGVMTFEHNTLVPRSTFAPSRLAWIKNYKQVLCADIRGGGEAGGSPLVDNYAAMDITFPISVPGTVSIKDCELYNAGPLVRFFDIPNNFVYVNNRGHVDSTPFWFDDGSNSLITPTTWANFNRYGSVDIRGNAPPTLDFLNDGTYQSASHNQAIGEMCFLAAAARAGCITPPVLDRIPQASIRALGNFLTSGVGPAGSPFVAWSASGSAPTSSPTGEYGSAHFRITASADGQGRTRQHARFLDYATLPGNRMYTLVLFVNATLVQPFVSILLTIGATNVIIRVRNGGPFVYCVPFVYLNTTGEPDPAGVMDAISVQVTNLMNGESIDFIRNFLIDGFFTYNHEVLHTKGTVFPAAYTPCGADTLGFQRGDICWRTDVGLGSPGPGPYAWICGTAGNPAQWHAADF